MKNINLYFDFEFTSLSPDAQPISLGIVSDEILNKTVYELSDFNEDRQKIICRHFIPDKIHFIGHSLQGVGFFECDIPELYQKHYNNATKYQFTAPVDINYPKSFYAEFSDFDLNRCDDWVKENVVSKLHHRGQQCGGGFSATANSLNYECSYHTERIKKELHEYLESFSDYQIQFICDCGVYDWYWMLQLLAEWDEKDNYFEYDPMQHPGAIKIPKGFDPLKSKVKTGLPKLPTNISPVPQDLNDLIAIKKCISVREAFDIERLGSFCQDNYELYNNIPKSHNALFDAKVIKESYQKLK